MNYQYVVKMLVSDLENADIVIPEFDDEGYRYLLLSCSEATWEDYGNMDETWIECVYADTLLLQDWASRNLVSIEIESL